MRKTFLIALLQSNHMKFWMCMFGKPKWTLKFDGIILLLKNSLTIQSFCRLQPEGDYLNSALTRSKWEQ